VSKSLHHDLIKLTYTIFRSENSLTLADAGSDIHWQDTEVIPPKVLKSSNKRDSDKDRVNRKLETEDYVVVETSPRVSPRRKANSSTSAPASTKIPQEQSFLRRSTPSSPSNRVGQKDTNSSKPLKTYGHGNKKRASLSGQSDQNVPPIEETMEDEITSVKPSSEVQREHLSRVFTPEHSRTNDFPGNEGDKHNEKRRISKGEESASRQRQGGEKECPIEID
jgi:hypothetical protein